jgi:hypothetical protein
MLQHSVVLPVVNAQVVAEFLAKQIVITDNKKSEPFKKSVAYGFIFTATKLLKNSPVYGVKFELAGK